MDKADLRRLVLETLRQKTHTQFPAIEKQCMKLKPDFQRDDALKVREVVWELLVQGVLAPGINSSNLDFPFVHVTEYGRQCLEADAILPHDPDGYLERLQQRAGQPLDDIVLTYVRESLLTFLAGHYLAATVMLGVASERCVDLLIEAYLNSIAEEDRKAAFERKTKQAGRSVKRRFDTLRGELLSLTLPTELQDALDIQLSGIFTLIRYSRNDAGHPTWRTIDRDTAHGNLLMFIHYCQRVYDLLDHFQITSV